MELRERVLAGALGGAVGTLVLSGLREAWSRMGLVFDTAPMQVVDRVEELGLVGDLSTGMHRALSVVAPLCLRSWGRGGLGAPASTDGRSDGRGCRWFGARGARLGRGVV